MHTSFIRLRETGGVDKVAWNDSMQSGSTPVDEIVPWIGHNLILSGKKFVIPILSGKKTGARK